MCRAPLGYFAAAGGTRARRGRRAPRMRRGEDAARQGCRARRRWGYGRFVNRPYSPQEALLFHQLHGIAQVAQAADDAARIDHVARAHGQEEGVFALPLQIPGGGLNHVGIALGEKL